MNFLDRSGHLFNLPSYSYEPVGHEFEDNDYIFYIDSKKTDKLSINNYYTRTIYIAIPFDTKNGQTFDDVCNIDITIDSNKFWLMSTMDIQKIVNSGNSIDEYFKYNINDDSKFKKLSNTDSDDDLLCLVFNEEFEPETLGNIKKHTWVKTKYAVIPIYVIGMSTEEGTWLTNILIHVYNKNGYEAVDEDWCSITVGGEFIEENEILTINAGNMGISLPKTLFKSIYQCSFINDEFNEQIYNEKVKEYLMNYMCIAGERGNYNSAINSLKWFGYGNHITIYKLLNTDNEIKRQFIRDNFDINYDMLESFKYFVNSTFISLALKENEETGEIYEQTLGQNQFWGENTPKLIDNFDRYIDVEYDYNNEKYRYIKPFYDFTFYEMGLKLSCLKYYYKKYFLPIYLNIHSASIEHKVYANNIKMVNETYVEHITETPIMTFHEKNQILFDKYKYKYFTHQIHYIDNKFNEWKETNLKTLEESDDKYYIVDDICTNIPITFINDIKLDENGNVYEAPTYFDCVLILEKENDIYSSKFPYRLKLNKKLNIVNDKIYIYEHGTNALKDLENYQWAFSSDNENWSLWKRNFSDLVEYVKDSYKYKIYSKEYDDQLQDNYSIELNVNNVNDDISYSLDCTKILIDDKYLSDIIGSNTLDINDKPQEIIKDSYYVYIPSSKELHTNVMNTFDVYSYVICVPPVYLIAKFDNVEVNDILVNYSSIKKNVEISFLNNTFKVYESHFSFVQDPNDLSSMYNSFVLYPSILGNQDKSSYINRKYILKLQVNGRWYEYRFETKIPDINIEFGKLEYQYYQDNNNFGSNFTQLYDISPNVYDENNELVQEGQVLFNNFMYEPKLAEINDINYFDNIENYIIKNNIKNINESLFTNFDTKYFIMSYKNGCNIKIFFNSELLRTTDEDFDNDKKLHNVFNVSNGILENTIIRNPQDPSLYILNEELLFVKSVYNRNNESDSEPIWERYYFYNPINTHKHKSVFMYDVNHIDIEDLNVYVDQNKKIWVSNNDNDFVNVKYYDAFFFIDNEHRYLDNFKSDVNIANNKKYLNNIVLYDIYEKNIKIQDLFTFNGNMNITCNGVLFRHDYKIFETDYIEKNDTTVQINKSSGIHISGMPVWDDNVYSNDIDYYSDFTNFDITKKDNYIFDATQNAYKLNKLFETYPDNPPITEAYKTNEYEIDNDSYFYYWYEDVFGKYYYTLTNVNMARYANEYAYKFIDNNVATVQQRNGIDNVSVATLYFSTFSQMMSMDLLYDSIIYDSRNNYTEENTVIYKDVVNNQLKFKVEFTDLDEEKHNFNNIQFKIKYVRKVGNTYIDVNENNSMTYEEKIHMLQNIPCENLYICVKLYNFATVAEMFKTDGYLNQSYVNSNELHLIEEASLSIKQHIGINKQLNSYIENKYRYVLLSEFKNKTAIIPVVVRGSVNEIYINYHNSYFPEENINKVNPNQPGQYIYDLSAITENFLEDGNQVARFLDKISEETEYNKFVIDISNDEKSLESYRNQLEAHRNKVNPYKESVRFDDYSYDKENMYVIKRITEKTGTYRFSFVLEFLSSDKEGNYYTQDEIKNLTCLMVNYRAYDDQTQTYSNNIVKEIKYNDEYVDVDLLNSKDIIDVIICIKLKDDENGSLNLHSKNNRKYISEFILYPIIQYVNITYDKLPYKKENDTDTIQDNISSVLENNYKQSADEIDLYNEFFSKKYIYRDNSNNVKSIDDIAIYNVERIYKIEKQYEIWNKKYSIVNYDESLNETINSYIYLKDKTNKEDRVSLYDIKNNEYLDINQLNIIDYQNFIVFAKYRYSVLHESDFYECKAYKETNGELSEIIIDEYSYDEKYYTFISPNVNIESFLDYDMYLMHDEQHWYVIFISKETIDKLDDVSKEKLLDGHMILKSKESQFDNENDYVFERDLNDNIIGVHNDFFYNNTKYELRYVKANNDLLINRMKFISANGRNTFNKNDVIAGKININNVLPVHIIHSSKWHIEPMSYKMDNSYSIDSNAEMTIIPYKKQSSSYDSGFYNVNVRYCIDKHNQYQYENTAKLRII